jgi:hypothetical protein
MSLRTLAIVLWIHLFVVAVPAFSFHQGFKRRDSVLFATGQKEENDEATVQVYDNAFTSLACEMLHYLALEHYERTSDGSSFFARPPHNERPLTPIEHAIDSALSEMGDNTKRVEYWSRDEYMNIDTHADIDEATLEDEGTVRCPSVGHVLYLQVKRGLHGPTCVFPKEQTGWGLNENKPGGDITDLIVVPAVKGRVLRFSGSSMHAVPNPPNRWLLNKKEEEALREAEESFEGEEEESDDDEYWRDDDDDDESYDEEEIERSVLLFNTWPDDEPGPRGVNGDIASGALPDGIELSEQDEVAFLKSQEAQILSEWKNDYGKDGQNVKCNPFPMWQSVKIEGAGIKPGPGSDVDFEAINVPLMGKENRRLYNKRYVELNGPREQIETAVREVSKVSVVALSL